MIFFPELFRRAAPRADDFFDAGQAVQRLFKNLAAFGVPATKRDKIQIETDCDDNLPSRKILKGLSLAVKD